MLFLGRSPLIRGYSLKKCWRIKKTHNNSREMRNHLRHSHSGGKMRGCNFKKKCSGPPLRLLPQWSFPASLITGRICSVPSFLRRCVARVVCA